MRKLKFSRYPLGQLLRSEMECFKAWWTCFFHSYPDYFSRKRVGSC